MSDSFNNTIKYKNIFQNTSIIAKKDNISYWNKIRNNIYNNNNKEMNDVIKKKSNLFSIFFNKNKPVFNTSLDVDISANLNINTDIKNILQIEENIINNTIEAIKNDDNQIKNNNEIVLIKPELNKSSSIPNIEKSNNTVNLTELKEPETVEISKANLDQKKKAILTKMKMIAKFKNTNKDDVGSSHGILLKQKSESSLSQEENTESKFSFITLKRCNADKNDTKLLEPVEIHQEMQYINLIREILDKGYTESGRNGDTLCRFGYNMRYSLKDGTIPILTTKKLAWRVCFEELFWFIRGCTCNKLLQDKKVHIWDKNSSREFLDSRGLYYLEEGDLGPIYGFQWRHFNAQYTNSEKCYKDEGIDQLQEIIETLKNPETRTSRRMIMTAWNPCQINYMALPPCHILAQFHVRENKYLSCALYQRSGDVGLGVPFNIASYSLLTHILAKHCGLEADEFVHFLGNCHIYKEHIEPLKKQIVLDPLPFPKIEILNTHDLIDEYNLDDILWKSPYKSHPGIKMDMKA